jgi:hypothetical protein
MKEVLRAILPFLFLLSSAALGEIGTTVYLSEPNMVLEPINVSDTLIEYPEIIVGTRLAIVVGSNKAEVWYGGMFVEGEYIGHGVLSGRGYDDGSDDPNDPNEPTFDYVDSHLPDAGRDARVRYWTEAGRDGFDFYTHSNTHPGDWFVLDYTANQLGPCRVGIYAYNTDPDGEGEWLLYELEFTHIPPDFNGTGIVDFGDLAILLDSWNEPAPMPVDPRGVVDLSGDGFIDLIDFTLFTGYWLEETEY